MDEAVWRHDCWCGNNQLWSVACLSRVEISDNSGTGAPPDKRIVGNVYPLLANCAMLPDFNPSYSDGIVALRYLVVFYHRFRMLAPIYLNARMKQRPAALHDGDPTRHSSVDRGLHCSESEMVLPQAELLCIQGHRMC